MIPSQFSRYVLESPTGCWVWQLYTDPWGYGRKNIRVDGKKKNVAAHRWSYELLVGEIPQGLEIDHLCRNTACVNPDHLEPVTTRENNARSAEYGLRHRAWTHCERGHEFDESNTYFYAVDNRRVCRRCNALAVERYRAKKAGAR